MMTRSWWRTSLILRLSGIERPRAGLRGRRLDDWAAKVAAGWHICLAVADRLPDGDPVGPVVGQNARNYGWDDLSKAYAKRLGAGQGRAR